MKQGTQNLYIDESGSGAIYEPPPRNYQFFNMAGVLLNDKSEQAISSAIRKWKKKFLIDQYCTFHAVDFFEDYKVNYRNKNLVQIKNFYAATIELIEVFLSIPYESQVFYIDLYEFRDRLGFNKYINGKQNILKDVINKDYRGRFLQPINTILEQFFSFHESYIIKTTKTGYLSFESQKEFDEQTLKTFHQTLQGHSTKGKAYKYGRNILGIHFDTKASLCAALELADFIAYCSTQFLRHKVNSIELHIQPERLNILLDAYKRIKHDRKISLRNCTSECIKDLKRIYKPQKKASK